MLDIALRDRASGLAAPDRRLAGGELGGWLDRRTGAVLFAGRLGNPNG